jgi:glycosyltransferase involved in cell wall biosynthesis
MKRPRVLHLISSGGFYGAERAVLDLCRAALTWSFSPILASFFDLRKPHLELHEAAEKEGVPTRLIRCKHAMDPLAIRQIRQVLLRDKVDILHCHGFKADFHGLLAAKSVGISLTATNHLWTGSSRIIQWYEWLDGFILRFFDRVVAVSAPIQDDLIRAGVIPRRIVIIPNGICLDINGDPLPETLRSEFGLTPDDIIIGVIARLSPEKGHCHLLRTAQMVVQHEPRARFLLVGDGPLRSVLEQEAEARGLKGSVIFTGVRRDMPRIYALLDLVVSASLREGLPISLLEALAAGCPVIATRVGDVPRIVRDGVTGILIDPGDEAGLGRAIMDLLKDAPRRRNLGQEGKRLVGEHFTAKRMARDYATLYGDILGVSIGHGPVC